MVEKVIKKPLKSFLLTAPEDLLERVDVIVRDNWEYQTRNDFARQALKDLVKREELKKANMENR